MVDNLYEEKIPLKDKVLSILCYIWLFPLFIIFFPNKSYFVKRNLTYGILFSIFITVWIMITFYIIRGNYNARLLNIINIIILTILLVLQMVQIIRILRKEKYVNN